MVRRDARTPALAALVLLNDEQFVEAARRFGARMWQAADHQGRIEHGFALAVGRSPDEQESQLLLGLFDEEQRRFTKDPAAATACFRLDLLNRPKGFLGDHAAYAIGCSC